MSGTASSDLRSFARTVHDFRSRRKEFFPMELFGEPAWDMLLDLYASEGEGRLVSATSASVASGAPITTGLRWIRHLEKHLLVERQPGARDRRYSIINLTPEGRKAVERCISGLFEAVGGAPTSSGPA
jgi:DNA-binding MarR family transcriptional regulator